MHTELAESMVGGMVTVVKHRRRKKLFSLLHKLTRRLSLNPVSCKFSPVSLRARALLFTVGSFPLDEHEHDDDDDGQRSHSIIILLGSTTKACLKINIKTLSEQQTPEMPPPVSLSTSPAPCLSVGYGGITWADVGPIDSNMKFHLMQFPAKNKLLMHWSISIRSGPIFTIRELVLLLWLLC